jgi:hypothetical protein
MASDLAASVVATERNKLPLTLAACVPATSRSRACIRLS